MEGAADADESARSWQWRGGVHAHVSGMSESKAETKTWQREHVQFPVTVLLDERERLMRGPDSRADGSRQ